LAGYLEPTLLCLRSFTSRRSSHHRIMKLSGQNRQWIWSRSRSARQASSCGKTSSGLDASRINSPHRGVGEIFLLTSPLIGSLTEHTTPLRERIPLPPPCLLSQTATRLSRSATQAESGSTMNPPETTKASLANGTGRFRILRVTWRKVLCAILSQERNVTIDGVIDRTRIRAHIREHSAVRSSLCKHSSRSDVTQRKRGCGLDEIPARSEVFSVCISHRFDCLNISESNQSRTHQFEITEFFRNMSRTSRDPSGRA
jgi:hypothetical protein